MSARLLAEIEGRVVPIADAAWHLIAPCGCIAGLAVIDTGLTPEAALRGFYESADEAAQAASRGLHCRLGLNQRTVMGGCHHTPKWGLPDD